METYIFLYLESSFNLNVFSSVSEGVRSNVRDGMYAVVSVAQHVWEHFEPRASPPFIEEHDFGCQRYVKYINAYVDFWFLRVQKRNEFHNYISVSRMFYEQQNLKP